MTTPAAAQHEPFPTREAKPSGAVRAPDTASPHGLCNRVARVLWSICYVVFVRYSPRPCMGWRRFWLRLFGATLGRRARVYPGARVWAPWNLTMGQDACLGDGCEVYCVARVTLGDRAAVSQYAYLCAATHDYRDRRLPLVPLPITLGCDVWIAADVFVGPGVTIGDGVVVGARSSVFDDLPPWTVCVGTPARAVKKRELGA